MRRIGLLVCVVLAGGIGAVAASAATGSAPDAVHLDPAATSVDHDPFCTEPGTSSLTATPTAGGTLVTFTLVAPGCD